MIIYRLLGLKLSYNQKLIPAILYLKMFKLFKLCKKVFFTRFNQYILSNIDKKEQKIEDGFSNLVQPF